MARTWCYETSIALGVELSNELAYNDYFEYYGPDFKLHVEPAPNVTNRNTPECLESIKCKLLENLSRISHAPSVQMTALIDNALDLAEREAVQKDACEDAHMKLTGKENREPTDCKPFWSVKNGGSVYDSPCFDEDYTEESDDSDVIFIEQPVMWDSGSSNANVMIQQRMMLKEFQSKGY